MEIKMTQNGNAKFCLNTASVLEMLESTLLNASFDYCITLAFNTIDIFIHSYNTIGAQF